MSQEEEEKLKVRQSGKADGSARPVAVLTEPPGASPRGSERGRDRDRDRAQGERESDRDRDRDRGRGERERDRDATRRSSAVGATISSKCSATASGPKEASVCAASARMSHRSEILSNSTVAGPKLRYLATAA